MAFKRERICIAVTQTRVIANGYQIGVVIFYFLRIDEVVFFQLEIGFGLA